MKRDVVKLCNADLNDSIFMNVMFLSLAESGAMGEPGAVYFYVKGGEAYYFNYEFGDVEMETVEKYFPVLSKCEFGMFGLDSKVPKGWHYVNLGMGNHLIVNNKVYDKFSELLGDEDEPSIVYGKWREIADIVLNGSR